MCVFVPLVLKLLIYFCLNIINLISMKNNHNEPTKFYAILASHKSQQQNAKLSSKGFKRSAQAGRMLGKEEIDSRSAKAGEFSPLFLLSQLSLFNKVSKKFKVTSENVNSDGERKVEVDLFLGDEVWHGSGSSIKKAKHNAASEALLKTKLPSKQAKKTKTFNEASFTPTVQLNAFAISNSLEVTYELESVQKVPSKNSFIISQHNQSYPSNNDYRARQHLIYNFKVNIGEKIFHGSDTSQQKARHNAAVKALKALRLDTPINEISETQAVKIDQNEIKVPKLSKEKSAITLVYEKASALKMDLTFDFDGPKGPPHMPQFSVKAELISNSKIHHNNENTIAFGKGKSKHQAKLNAALEMLEKIEKLDKSETTIKGPAFTPKYTQSVIAKHTLHPVSRLIQIMHAKKMKEPEFTVISCDKKQRIWEFFMQCQLEDGKTSVGHGGSKKLAKQDASERMLELLGYKTTTKQEDTQSNENVPKILKKINPNKKKVTFDAPLATVLEEDPVDDK